jgi:hypothetical protein
MQHGTKKRFLKFKRLEPMDSCSSLVCAGPRNNCPSHAARNGAFLMCKCCS